MKKDQILNVIRLVVRFVLTAILWVLFFWYLIYMLVGTSEAKAQTLHIMYVLLLVSVVVFLLLVFWRYYNYFRFAKKNRRKFAKQPDIAEIAELYGMTAEEVEQIRDMREIDVRPNQEREGKMYIGDPVLQILVKGPDEIRKGFLERNQDNGK